MGSGVKKLQRCESGRIEDFPEIVVFPSTDYQPAFLGSTALPVPGVVSAALGCPVTTRRGVVAAQLESRGPDVRKVRTKQNIGVSKIYLSLVAR